MGKFEIRDLNDIIGKSEIGETELVIRCPKVTYNVEIDGRVEPHTYHDITEVFNDFEEGKVMGRRLILER